MTSRTLTKTLETNVLATNHANQGGTSSAYSWNGGTLTSGAAVINLNGYKITGSATPTASTDLATRGYVDSVAISGTRIKETLLSQLQVASNAQGVRPAFAMYFTAQPDALTAVSLVSDTHAAETFTEGTEWVIGGTVAITMGNLAAAITAGTNFDAKYCPELDQFNSPNGVIVVVTKTTPATNDDFRAYSTDVVNTSIVSYNSATATAAGGASPTPNYSFENVAGVFVANATDPGANVDYGGRQYLASAATEGQTHWVIQENAWYTWDADADQWNLMSSNSVAYGTSGSGGAIAGRVTADSDLGLSITGNGILRINLATDPGLEFSSGALRTKVDAAGAITRTASGLGVNLEASNPTLKITANELGVKLYASGGLETSANGVQINVDATNGTTSINGSNEIVAVPSALGVEQAVNEALTLSGGDITAGYKDLTNMPVNKNAVHLVIRSGTSVSSKQTYGTDFTIVQTANNNNIVKRVVFLNTLTPGGAEIPDGDDLAPTAGMTDVLAASDILDITFTKLHA